MEELLSLSQTDKLPKAEYLKGEIDFPEMIRADYRKAILVHLLSATATLLVTGGLFLLAFFLLK